MSAIAHGKNVPSLDLLRSYAIVSVVAAHAVLAFGAPPALAPLRAGGTGVDLFFILSGWLLGGQLMRELAATGTISFTRFWSRRWMRTLPAYYAVLCATFLQQAILKNNTDLRWSYWFFGQNYLTDLPYFFVSWSLCVEEHFYLFVAPLLLIAFRLRQRGIVLLLLVMAAPSACRTFGLYGAIVETHVRFDECLLGVVLAGLSVFFRGTWARLCALAPILASVGLVLYAGLVLVRWYPEFPLWVDEQTICMFVFGSFLLFAVSSEKWKQRLYIPGCAFLAARAYSVYLLHPEAVALLRRLEMSSFPLFLLLTWLMTLAGSEILYRLVERPGMNAREWFKFSAAQSPATSLMPPERHE